MDSLAEKEALTMLMSLRQLTADSRRPQSSRTERPFPQVTAGALAGNER